MANSYATVVNGRNNTIRIGGRSGVLSAHVRGWNAGVRIERLGKTGDVWRVYMTGGSAGAGGTVFLGQVTLGIDGPEWEPSPFRTDTDDTRADDSAKHYSPADLESDSFGPGGE